MRFLPALYLRLDIAGLFAPLRIPPPQPSREEFRHGVIREFASRV